MRSRYYVQSHFVDLLSINCEGASLDLSRFRNQEVKLWSLLVTVNCSQSQLVLVSQFSYLVVVRHSFPTRRKVYNYVQSLPASIFISVISSDRVHFESIKLCIVSYLVNYFVLCIVLYQLKKDEKPWYRSMSCRNSSYPAFPSVLNIF